MDSPGFITRLPIDLPALVKHVEDSGFGATTSFLGTVRRSVEDGDVVAIEYSAYEEMLKAEFARIVGEAAERWPETRVIVQHRLGKVALGEASIAIVAGSPHRAEAFDACRYAIEETKRRLPVWKKEHFEGGVTAWRE